MDEPDLERLIDKALKELPVPRAPSTLLPAVLAAATSLGPRPGDRWDWSNWAPAARFVFAGLTGSLLVGLVLVEPLAQRVVGQTLGLALQPLRAMTDELRAALGVAEVLRRVLFEFLPDYVTVLGVMMGMACAVMGAMLTRITSLGEKLP